MVATNDGIDLEVTDATFLVNNRRALLDGNSIANRALAVGGPSFDGVQVAELFANARQIFKQGATQPVVSLDVSVDALEGEGRVAPKCEGTGNLFRSSFFLERLVNELPELSMDATMLVRDYANPHGLVIRLIGLVGFPAVAPPEFSGDCGLVNANLPGDIGQGKGTIEQGVYLVSLNEGQLGVVSHGFLLLVG